MHITRGRNITPPFPATMVIVSLAVFVPLSAYVCHGLRVWQFGDSPAFALTEPYFIGIWIGRTTGAVALAILLLFWRHPLAIAATLIAIWLAGPPLTLMFSGLEILAISGGQAAWPPHPLSAIAPATLFAILITAALLIPRSVRQAYNFC